MTFMQYINNYLLDVTTFGVKFRHSTIHCHLNNSLFSNYYHYCTFEIADNNGAPLELIYVDVLLTAEDNNEIAWKF